MLAKAMVSVEEHMKASTEPSFFNGLKGDFTLLAAIQLYSLNCMVRAFNS